MADDLKDYEKAWKDAAAESDKLVKELKKRIKKKAGRSN